MNELGTPSKKVIRFKRIATNVSAYEIYCKETVNGSETSHLLATIDNPNKPNLIEYTEPLECNNGVCTFPKNFVEDAGYTLYVNGAELLSSEYSIDFNKKIISINNYNGTDAIEMKFFKDEIEYVVPISSSCTYIIKPIFISSVKFIDHYVLS